MIYTSYFSKISKFPKGCRFVSICGKAPTWYRGAQYKKLAPKFWFFQKYKEDNDSDYYTEQYYKEVLDPLNPDMVVRFLCRLVYFDAKNNISTDEDTHIVLLCYEKPGDFCHRHLVAEWLTNNGYPCKELEI